MAYSGEGNLIEAVILNDPNKTVIPVVCDSEGRLIIDLNGSSITIGTVQIEDSTGNPIVSTGGSLNVDVTSGTVTVVQPTGTNLHTTVDNFPATQPISGAVTEVNVDKNFGAWSYYAGSFGTVTVSGGQRVLGIGVHATTAGVLTINGGASIPIPAGVSINIEPLANLVAPTIVFTNTDSYMVEVVS
jgi:hypothetical protein